MKLSEALDSLAEHPGDFVAFESHWKKASYDATGYGQFHLIFEKGHVPRWVAWEPKGQRLIEGGIFRPSVNDFTSKQWGVRTVREMNAAALACLNELELKNLKARV
jgi:hypothetical protein